MSSPFGNTEPPTFPPPSGGRPSDTPSAAPTEAFGVPQSLSPHTDAFASSGAASTPTSTITSPVSGPWPFIIAANVCAGLGLLLALLAVVVGGSATDSGFRTLAIVGWLLAGIVGFSLVGLHKVADNRRKAESLYIENLTQVLLTRTALIVGFVGVVISAIEISLWFSKTVGA